MAANKIDARQSRLTSTQSMLGSSGGDTLDTIFPKINDELAKLFEDRNLLLVSDGTITFSAVGTTVTFSSNLRLHINSQVAGGSPTIIDLTSTTRTLSTSGKMIYAIINRAAGTATVTDDSSTLPSVTSSNQEVVLIAKRVDAADGTKRIYFRNGFSLSAGQTARFGQGGTVFTNEFSIADATDTTKKIAFSASGSSTATTLTITDAQTTTQSLAIPNVSSGDSLVTNNTVAALTNKSISYTSSNDSTTTGSAATAQAFTTGIIRLTNASLVSLSGIPAGSSGQFVIIENKTGNQIIINNEETTATANNRIQTGTNSNISMPNNATFMFTYDTTSSRWQLSGGSGSGSGGSGSKNYLSAVTTSQSATPNTGNGNFESGSTTGFSLGTVGTLTNGIPTGSPTFGSGASGNLSISVVNTNTLAGAYSLSYASSTATTQGNMLASDPFYIDNSDQGKVLSFSLSYKAQVNPANANFSGTASNSFGVAVWDVTNSAWLSLAGNFNFTQNSGIGQCTGTFQTAINTTQLRFVFYNVNATAGAFTMYLDDITVGPQLLSVTSAGFSARVQKTTAQIGISGDVKCTFNSVSYDNAGLWDATNNWFKITQSGRYRFNALLIFGSVTAGEYIRVRFVKNNATNLSESYSYVPTGTTDSSQVATDTFDLQPGDTIHVIGGNNGATFDLAVGVVGAYFTCEKVATALVTEDARVVDGQFVNSGTQSVIQITDTVLVYNSIKKDSHGAFNTSNNRYTIPVSGDYQLSAYFTTSSSSAAIAGGSLHLKARVNGTATYVLALEGIGAQTAVRGIAGSTMIPNLKAGDYIEMLFYNDYGTTFTTIAGLSVFSINRLSGPSTIAASETINMSYGSTAGSSIGTSLTLQTFTAKEIDSHGGWNGTDTFTAPVSGIYSVAAGILTAAVTLTTAQSATLAVYKNGVLYRYLSRVNGTGASNVYMLTGTDLIKLSAGETLQIYAVASVATAQNTAGANNKVTITRVGN